MKVIVELHGATKDLSKKNFLEINLEKNSSIKDLKFQLIKFIEKILREMKISKNWYKALLFALKMMKLFLKTLKLIRVK